MEDSAMSDIDVTTMGDAGKAMPVPRGRYSDTETYDYLDFVYSGDASYIAKKLTTGNPPAENNEYWQLFARGGTLTENSDVSDTTVTFEQAENRANIFSKDSLKTIMGKISKMYSDLKTVAFSGKYTDLEGRVTVTNNDLATIPGTAWDAVRGAQIRKDLDKLNSDFTKLNLTEAFYFPASAGNLAEKLDDLTFCAEHPFIFGHRDGSSAGYFSIIVTIQNKTFGRAIQFDILRTVAYRYNDAGAWGDWKEIL